MSEQKFKEAKKHLAFSQSLVDKFRLPQQTQNMAQPSPEMTQPSEQPQSAQPQDNQVQLVSSIKEALTPMFDDLKKTLTEEEKQVELKIEGEMTPKE